jgi:DNA-binding XRE family transcriptional regulator
MLNAERPKNRQYPNNLNKLGDHLRNRRLELGLIQRDVSQRIGVDEDTICRWESNKTSPSVNAIWERISKKTRYLVRVNTERLIESCAHKVQELNIATPQIKEWSLEE